MKIVLINTYFYPDMYGGTEKVILDLARKYNKNNEVFVICLGKETKQFKYENIVIYKINNGYNLYPSNIAKKMKNKFIDTFGSKLKEFERILKEIKPDIVHTHGLPGISSKIWEICYKNNIKIVDTIHDYWKYSFDGKEKSIGKIINFIHNHMLRKNSKYVNYVTAPTKFMLDPIKKLKYYKNAEKKVIPNGFDINYVDLENILIKKKQKEFINVKFLYVGQLIEKKGILNFIDSYMRVNGNNEHCMLSICGDGDCKSKLLEKIKKNNNIRYLGKLNEAELKKVYSESDILVVPSLWNEPFGLVTIEGLLFGLIVLGSNNGGIAENLKKMSIDSIFDPKDNCSFDGIIRYFSIPKNIYNYYNNLIIKDQINLIRQFDIDNIVVDYLEIYK